MTKVPDRVIFGIDSLGNSIDYGFVRKVTDENELIYLLYLRLKVLFFDQVQHLQQPKAAFPLTAMTCVGIETLGEIFVKKNINDNSFQFVEITRKVDQRFGRKPNKKYEQKLKEIWSENDLKNIDSFGKLTYRFFRNTMIHGYQAKGVYLSYEYTKDIKINDEDAFVIINPDWFWDSFKSFFEEKFAQVKQAQANSTERQNCLNYIKIFLLG